MVSLDIFAEGRGELLRQRVRKIAGLLDVDFGVGFSLLVNPARIASVLTLL